MNTTPKEPFRYRCLVSCAMLQPEIQHLFQSGFLENIKIYFTPAGLHALPERLEASLLERLAQAERYCQQQEIVVVYGKKCFVSTEEPLKRMDTILAEYGEGIARVRGDYGYDMLAGLEERQQISSGRQDKILWFTPGWLRNWQTVFQNYFGWDHADANANFPGFYDRIIVLDGLGVEEDYMTNRAEQILELFDWTGLIVEFHPISLERFKGLLSEAFNKIPRY